jgi:hypothetical protein
VLVTLEKEELEIFTLEIFAILIAEFVVLTFKKTTDEMFVNKLLDSFTTADKKLKIEEEVTLEEEIEISPFVLIIEIFFIIKSANNVFLMINEEELTEINALTG